MPLAVMTAVTPVVLTTASTLAPVFTYSEGNVVVYIAASIMGVSPKLVADFEKRYHGHTVVFSLDGSQATRTLVQNGAYADACIYASIAYTWNSPQVGTLLTGQCSLSRQIT